MFPFIYCQLFLCYFFFFRASNLFVRSSKSMSSSSPGPPWGVFPPRGVSLGTAGRSGRSRTLPPVGAEAGGGALLVIGGLSEG